MRRYGNATFLECLPADGVVIACSHEDHGNCRTRSLQLTPQLDPRHAAEMVGVQEEAIEVDRSGMEIEKSLRRREDLGGKATRVQQLFGDRPASPGRRRQRLFFAASRMNMSDLLPSEDGGIVCGRHAIGNHYRNSTPVRPVRRGGLMGRAGRGPSRGAGAQMQGSAGDLDEEAQQSGQGFESDIMGGRMHGEPAGQFLLATLPPSPAQRRLAIAIILTLLAAFVVTAPFRAIQLPKSGALITAFQTVLFVNDLMTATLLFSHFLMLRWRSCLRSRAATFSRR